MNTTSKWLAIVAVAFVAGSFVASPELRAYAANTVRSIDIVDGEVKTADLANNAVTAGKVKDGEIKAAEIAADAVGGSELQGVTKILFGQCAADSNEGTAPIPPGDGISIQCTINGVDADDTVIALNNHGDELCLDVRTGEASTNSVFLNLGNSCTTPLEFGTGSKIGILVFDK